MLYFNIYVSLFLCNMCVIVLYILDSSRSLGGIGGNGIIWNLEF